MNKDNYSFLQKWGINPNSNPKKRMFSSEEEKAKLDNIIRLVASLKSQVKVKKVEAQTPSCSNNNQFLIVECLLNSKELKLYSDDYPKEQVIEMLKENPLNVFEKLMIERLKNKWGNQTTNFITPCLNCKQKGLNTNLDNWFYCVVCGENFDWEQVQELKEDSISIRKEQWELVSKYRKQRIETDNKILEGLQKEVNEIQKRINQDKEFINKEIANDKK